MPKLMNSNFEKAKDFKGTIKRLFKELKIFKALILISIVLAAFSSILSIMAPDKLSSLVDEISQGLIIDKNGIKQVSDKVIKNISGFDINKITENNRLTEEEKTKIIITIKNVNFEDKNEIINFYNNMPKKILKIFLPTIYVDKQKITSKDQLLFLNITSKMKEKTDYKKIYKKIDKMPLSIKKVIEPKMNVKRIKNIVIFLIIIYVLSSLFSYIQSLSMAIVSNNFAKELRKKISIKINLLPLKYFDKNQTGDILSRVTNDVDTVSQSLNQSLSTLVSSATLLIGTIIMMFITNWIMAITAIISSLFGFLFMSLILSKSQKYFIQRQKSLGAINGHIEEVYSGLNIVKVYNAKIQVDKKFDKLNEKVYEANKKSQFLSGLIMPMMGFVGNFGYVAVCIVGALLTMNGNITFGVIVAFITYVRLFTSPLSQIGQAMTSFQSASAASERVFEILDEKQMPKENKSNFNYSNAIGNIIFKNVNFTYDGNTKPTINNFSADVKKGQKIAIVGPTGSGKTTIVNLLMKFYDINSGDILIDGKSIKEITRYDIHNLFTMVLQDTWLFDGTIKENIIYNRKNISDKRIKEICKIVGVDHFINTLPNGYDSKITNIDNISSGQKQLLTIARAMILDTPFLILDEATSNVDTRTEELVAKAMDKLTEGRTSFIIAHRLSTIKNADLILVMKNGKIIEKGEHKKLMENNGFYAELYNSQFEL